MTPSCSRSSFPDAAGDTLVFPTVQECAEGESAWVQVPAEGEDGHDLELPAPLFELTSAAGDGHAADEAAAETVADDAEADAAASDGSASAESATSSDGPPAALTWTALVLAAAGLVLGALGFVRSRPRA